MGILLASAALARKSDGVDVLASVKGIRGAEGTAVSVKCTVNVSLSSAMIDGSISAQS
jgi:hypothetical protein